MNWAWGWDAVTAVATSVYALLVALTIALARKQLLAMNEARKMQSVLAVFREIHAKEARDARRYIYQKVPREIAGIEAGELQRHLEAAEEALIAFDRLGYMLKAGHISVEPIAERVWSAVWRCWTRSKELIRWAQEQRSDPTYLDGFKYLFDEVEAYRASENLPESSIYP